MQDAEPDLRATEVVIKGLYNRGRIVAVFVTRI
jgi:hypothetical protein